MVESEYVGVSEAAEILAVCRQRVTKLAARDDFPAPVGTIRAGTFWRRVDIETYAVARADRVARYDPTPKRRATT